MNYRWIQLSDVHFAYKNYHTNRMRLKLLEKLEETSKEKGLDFVFITGDLTDKSHEYGEEALIFFSEILDIVGLDSERIFLVPGNHDVQRSIARKAVLEGLLLNDKVFANINNELSEKQKTELINGLEKFINFYGKVKKKPYPKEKIHYVEKSGDANIVHINTAWLSGLDEEEGNLCIGVNELFKCLSHANIEPDKLNIALGHHSIEMLNEKEREQVQSLFFDYNIDFYFCGHSHDSQISYNPHIETIFCTCRQVRSDSYDTGGYIIGNINTEAGDNFLEFYTWNQKGFWTIDNDVGLQAVLGKYYFDTPKFPRKCHDEQAIIVYKTLNVSLNINRLINRLNVKNPEVYEYPYYNLEISKPEDWEYHRQETRIFINELKENLRNKTISIFPIAQIPLLIYMGYLLSNDSDNIVIYQYDDINALWVYGRDNVEVIPLRCDIKNHGTPSSKLIILLEISSKININDIHEVINTEENPVLTFSIPSPKRNRILYYQQVREIKNVFRMEMEEYIYDYEEIHMFYAGPAGLAIEIGRCIQKNMWPSVFIYNYVRSLYTRYQLAFNIKPGQDNQ